MKKYLKLLRIKHYVKNILIFLPLLFSYEFFNNNNLLVTLISFFIFSFTCSIIYILNDLKDIEKDRLHETKKNRPLASGKVSKKQAIIIQVVLFVIVSLLLYIIKANFETIIWLSIYFILNVLYSYGLKKLPIIDIVILTSGFVIRVFFGASIINVEVSNWLFLTIMAFAFYLSMGKRKKEFKKSGETTRNVLKYYNYEFLDKNMYLCLALGVMFYSLWTVDPIVNNSSLIWSVPIVLIILFKYNLNLEGNSDGDPVEVILRDKILLSLILLYGLFMLGCVYYL